MHNFVTIDPNCAQAEGEERVQIPENLQPTLPVATNAVGFTATYKESQSLIGNSDRMISHGGTLESPRNRKVHLVDVLDNGPIVSRMSDAMRRLSPNSE
jgi:hypothetical protein